MSAPLRQLLVLGPARAGTTYTSRVLRAVGLGVTHEGVGAAGCVSCFMAADSLPPPDPRKREKHADGTLYSHFQWAHTFYQVRDPLKLVASNEKVLSRADLEWMAPFTGIDPGWPRRMRAIRYVIAWDLLCKARNPDWMYRVEDLPDVWDEFLQRAGLPSVPFPKGISTRVNASSGAWKAEELGWPDLRRADAAGTDVLRALSQEWGYE